MAKKKLLILDPQIEDRQTVLDAANAIGFSPYITKTISEAMGVAQLEGIHAAWLDMVPNDELAIELIQEVKERFPAAPVGIFLPDKQMLVDKVLSKDELVELGVAKIYFRPLDYPHIAKSFFDSPKSEEKERSFGEDDEALLIFDYEFAPVPIKNFIPGSKVFFDTYVR